MKEKVCEPLVRKIRDKMPIGNVLSGEIM